MGKELRDYAANKADAGVVTKFFAKNGAVNNNVGFGDLLNEKVSLRL